MLRFERQEGIGVFSGKPYVRWDVGVIGSSVLAVEGEISIRIDLYDAADLAELRRVLDQAEEVAGWREEDDFVIPSAAGDDDK